MRINRVVVALGAALSLVFPGHAAQDPQEPAFRAHADAVVVDVVVRSRDRQPVTSLTVDDFEVFENGVPQRIDSFSTVGGSDALMSTTGVQGQEAERSDTVGDALDSDPPPVVAMMFDRLSVQGRTIAHRAARAFVGNDLEAPAMTAVYVLNNWLQLVQPYTTDGARLRRAVDAVGGLPTNEEDEAAIRKPLTPRLTGVHPARVPLLMRLRQPERRSVFTADSILSVVRHLAAVPGRKSLIVLSEAFESMHRSATRADLQLITAEANRANVAIYPFDASGLGGYTPFMQAREILGGHLGGGDLRGGLGKIEEIVAVLPDATFGRLATDTGGFFLRDTNDLTRGFRRVAEDMSHHYVLAYSSSNPTYDGKYRRIKVKVGRPRTSVVARRGYYATPPGDTPTIIGLDDEVAALLDMTPVPNDFPLHLESLVFPARDALAAVPIVVQADVAHLAFESLDDETARAEAVATLRVRTLDGRVVEQAADSYLVEARTSDVMSVRSRPLLLHRQLRLPAGVYIVEAAVRDMQSGASSVRVATLEVPPVPAGVPHVSSVFLVRYAEAGARGRAHADSALLHDGVLLYPNAGRILRRAVDTDITFAFTVTGVDGVPLDGAAVQVLRGGTVVGDAPLTLEPPDGEGRIRHLAGLPIGTLEPGPHTLRVVVWSGDHRVFRHTQFTIE